MKIVFPVHDYDYSEGLKSGVINGGTVWFDNLAQAFREIGEEAELVDKDKYCEGDLMIMQSEWVGSNSYNNFKGDKIIYLGHFIKHVYPDPHEIKDKKITMWKGECVEPFQAEFVPHAFNSLNKVEESEYNGIIWIGNPYGLRNLEWLGGLKLIEINGVLPSKLNSIYKGNVCPNIHGNFQLGIVEDHPAKIADKPGYMINERFWQVIGSGGILISDYNHQILEFFDEDEIIMCKTKEDFQKNCEYYLKHRQEGIDFYKRAREKILRDHTYINRAKQIKKIYEDYIGRRP